MPIHPRDDLIAEVCVVFTNSGRVNKLAASERCPGIYPNQNARRSLSLGEQHIREFRDISSKRAPVSPHVKLSGKALNQVDARIPSLPVVSIAGR